MIAFSGLWISPHFNMPFKDGGYTCTGPLFHPKTGPTLPMGHNLVLSSKGSIAFWSPFPHKLGHLFSSAAD